MGWQLKGVGLNAASGASMDRVVVFNIAWMKGYNGVAPDDVPIHGGKYVDDNLYGAEVYNFQPYRGKTYGFVEAGWKPRPCCINITKLGASRGDIAIPGILVIWVARHPYKPQTLVVGWYKRAIVYRERQEPPQGSTRKEPDGGDAPYFVEADERDCVLIPEDGRDLKVPRGVEGGLGQKNIWYLDSPLGAGFKSKILAYVRRWESAGS